MTMAFDKVYNNMFIKGIELVLWSKVESCVKAT